MVKKKIKYQEPPMIFDVALRKFVPDIVKIKEMKKKLRLKKGL